MTTKQFGSCGGHFCAFCLSADEEDQHHPLKAIQRDCDRVCSQQRKRGKSHTNMRALHGAFFYFAVRYD